MEVMVLLTNSFRATGRINRDGERARFEGGRGACAEGLGLWRNWAAAGWRLGVSQRSARFVGSRPAPLRHTDFPSLGEIPPMSSRRKCWGFQSAPGCRPRAETQPVVMRRYPGDLTITGLIRQTWSLLCRSPPTACSFAARGFEKGEQLPGTAAEVWGPFPDPQYTHSTLAFLRTCCVRLLALI